MVIKSNPMALVLSELAALPHLPMASKLLVRAAITYATWRTRARTRYDLRGLDRHMLKDIGITPEAAREESAKHFWLP